MHRGTKLIGGGTVCRGLLPVAGFSQIQLHVLRVRGFFVSLVVCVRVCMCVYLIVVCGLFWCVCVVSVRSCLYVHVCMCSCAICICGLCLCLCGHTCLSVYVLSAICAVFRVNFSRSPLCPMPQLTHQLLEGDSRLIALFACLYKRPFRSPHPIRLLIVKPLMPYFAFSGRCLVRRFGLPSTTPFFVFSHSNPASTCTFKVSSTGSAEDAWASADASLASYSRQRNGPTLVLSQGLVHGQVR